MPGSVVRMIPTGPGIGTCDPLGQNLWCAGDIKGAWFNDAWKTFRVWALAPTISSFSPASGPVGAGVPLSGLHLTGATPAAFHGAAGSLAVNSDPQIPATETRGPASSAASFTVTVAPSAPMISSFSPASGPVGAGVTISGSHFTGATAVAFNGAAASFAVNSDTQITATVPSGATTGPISVTTPGGTATSATSFTVTVAPSAPMISSFSPASGPVGAGVTISGSHFTGATAVAFNGAAASFAVNSDTQITATAPRPEER